MMPNFRPFHLLALLMISAILASCGFALRGSYSLPYESIYISGADHLVSVANLKRAIRASGSTTLATDPKEAEAIFIPAGETRETQILSLTGSGRVREKRLVYRYSYRVVDSKGSNLIPPGTVEMSRDLTYADSAVLAKEQEEALLWRDMENDLVQQLMRRLSATTPRKHQDE